MKYFFYRFEIQDGEHGYFHRGVVSARNIDSATKKAEQDAKTWYDEKPDVEDNNRYYFPSACVMTWVDEVREIPKNDYEILKQYL